jgi:hypothetical protein
MKMTIDFLTALTALLVSLTGVISGCVAWWKVYMNTKATLTHCENTNARLDRMECNGEDSH